MNRSPKYYGQKTDDGIVCSEFHDASYDQLASTIVGLTRTNVETKHGLVKAWEATNLVTRETFKLNDPKDTTAHFYVD